MLLDECWFVGVTSALRNRSLYGFDRILDIILKGASAQPLLERMMAIDPAQISTTIISYEEQMRG
jgi:hypothetical protein